MPIAPLPVRAPFLDLGPHYLVDFRASGGRRVSSGDLWRVLAGEPAEVCEGTGGAKAVAPLIARERALRLATLDWRLLAPEWAPPARLRSSIGLPSHEAAQAGLVERRRYGLDGGHSLFVLIADAGPAVHFVETSGAPVHALGTRQGRTAEAAFLWIDLEDTADLTQYFLHYGAPPDLDLGGAPSPWAGTWSPEGVRWVTLGRLERLQKGLQAAVQAGRLPGADWYRDEPPAAVWRPEYGRLGVGENGLPQLQIDLWQAVAYRIAEDIVEGRIGRCEAPKLYSPKERCGRPFVRSRAGLSQYCSAACRSRAGTQLYLKRRLEGEHTEDPHGT